ncbi:Lrp/AsnC family transcriptional regulator [Noviherbaspirillum sp.]|uniref:Lrp/AsnC family transcriptional regulator n=1 Tax=Noviherbaspirillum sp. TaxID=1926288 RepID=UPI002D2498DD|nr:Lrp/AsnC family transcriptional regulator [Noviherbaspirillum sp.]HZW20324.1 Lrp/AsnC family transcriptional regulator [Noviherbaspirillum sp.]
MALDRLDIQILNALQEDASVPLRELADRVHASVATCQRRIAQLKTDGYLLKQVGIVDRNLVGRPLTVFVSVEMEKQNDVLLRAFERKMMGEGDVMACYEVSGEFDFLLIVNSASMESYHAFTRRVFTSMNNVRNFKSNFAMNCSKFETKIPLDLPDEERRAQ